MSLIAQYYECSAGIYNNVDCCKKTTTKQQNHSKLSKGRNCKTYRKVAPTMKWCEM